LSPTGALALSHEGFGLRIRGPRSIWMSWEEADIRSLILSGRQKPDPCLTCSSIHVYCRICLGRLLRSILLRRRLCLPLVRGRIGLSPFRSASPAHRFACAGPTPARVADWSSSFFSICSHFGRRVHASRSCDDCNSRLHRAAGPFGASRRTRCACAEGASSCIPRIFI
jgi:hypothetical protein